MNRSPSYAGSFYPAQSDELNQMLKLLISKADTQPTPNKCLGIIVPHAGYIYSGLCAAHGYNYISKRKIKQIILIAPSHQGAYSPFSLCNYDQFDCVRGFQPIHHEHVSALMKNPVFTFDPSIDKREHSLEVQLPFINYFFPDVPVLPIIFNFQNLKNAILLKELLFPIINEQPDDTLIIISSDLSHFHSAENAELMDQQFISYILKHDTQSLSDSVQNRETEACGFGGIMTMIELAKAFNYSHCQLLNYTHSGYQSGDMRRVVGYCTISFEKGD